MNPGDLFARWMAEVGRSSTDLLKTRLQWLASTLNLGISSTEPGRWLRDTAALGHVEVDWATGQWRAAPLVITRVPAGDGLALICGLRTAVTDELVQQSDVELHRTENPGGARELPRPSTLFVQFDPGVALGTVAHDIRATYVPCSAELLANKLPVISASVEAAPPARDNPTLESFDPHQLRWNAATGQKGRAGAYKYSLHGHMEFRWHDGDTWWRTDLSGCVYLALRTAGISAMRWRPEGPGARTGRLFVDWGAPLPPLQQRAAVLCSGLMPRFAASARSAAYENVPRVIAQRIAFSLQQRLEET
ncbi:hypothetical protein AB0C29_00320 [Actinoplanes sp. NPDC048791]|uniref:hypothetical protein n=1 Tax=Actinoplanes sp. NPDC048791 TaxID=3154623 RepID=UPI0033F3154B